MTSFWDGESHDNRCRGGRWRSARFIRALCPVLELGLVGQTMHQIDERVPEAELRALADAYQAVIRTVFERLAV